MHKKDRFGVLKEFEEKVKTEIKDREIRYKLLKLIDDPDEKQESLHSLRFLVRKAMMRENMNLVNMANIAKSSSTRAYTGHSHDLRHIFDINKLNFTEYVRIVKNINFLYYSSDRLDFTKK